MRAVCSRTHLTLSLAIAAAEQLPKIKQAMSSGLSLSENITIKILRQLGKQESKEFFLRYTELDDFQCELINVVLALVLLKKCQQAHGAVPVYIRRGPKVVLKQIRAKDEKKKCVCENLRARGSFSIKY